MPALPQEMNGDDAPENDFEPIDSGSYNATIIGSNGKKKDSGHYVVGLQFKVDDGPKTGRTFWLNFNFINPNSAVNQDISQKQLRQIAKAIGISAFDETEALHGRAMNITVKRKEDPGYSPRNEMSSVRPYANPTPGGARPAATNKPAATSKPAPAGAGGGGRPWK